MNDFQKKKRELYYDLKHGATHYYCLKCGRSFKTYSGVQFLSVNEIDWIVVTHCDECKDI